MRYALHNVEDSTEVRFRTLDELWQHVQANGLCSGEPPQCVLNPRFEIHDFDACGVVRTEPRTRTRAKPGPPDGRSNPKTQKANHEGS